MPEQGLENGLITRAAKYAAGKHRLQKRKDEQTPYVNHVIEVADTLASVGLISDVEVLAAALLHDTIEDTDASAEEIGTIFGARVLSLVLECTDDKSLEKAERKRRQIADAPHKSDDAKLIKIADKISNIRDIVLSPPPSWSWQRRVEYLDWAEAVFTGLSGVNFALDERFRAELESGRRKLQEDRSSG